jgi:hypothetical protein
VVQVTENLSGRVRHRNGPESDDYWPAIHPAVEAGVEALAAHPTCPHVAMVTVTQSARCDECTAGIVAQSTLDWAVKELLPVGLDDTMTWLREHGRSTTPDVGLVLADVAVDLMRAASEIERAGGDHDR